MVTMPDKLHHVGQSTRGIDESSVYSQDTDEAAEEHCAEGGP